MASVWLKSPELVTRLRAVSDRFFSALGRVVVRFRCLVVAVWIALIVVTSAALPSLGSEVNNDNSQFLPASAPSSAGGNARRADARRGQRQQRGDAIVARAQHGALDGADQAALERLVGTGRARWRA